MIEVGLFPYPMPDPLPASSCAELPASSAPPTAEAEFVEVSALTIDTPGVGAKAEVVVHNTGSSDLHLEFGLPTALLYPVGGDTAVSASDYAVDDVLIILDIEPGGTEPLQASIGAASCNPANGYRVPAGDYDLVVVIDTIVSERFPVTVTA